jgi:hypothetical protein
MYPQQQRREQRRELRRRMRDTFLFFIMPRF